MQKRLMQKGLVLFVLLLLPLHGLAERVTPIYNVERGDKVLSISFDTSYESAHTLEILDILDQYGVKTTFFLLGEWVSRHPDLASTIAGRGHEIGTHSTTHPHLPKLSEGKIREEVVTVADSIQGLLGRRPTLIRLPYGEYNNTVMSVCQEQGFQAIQWNVDSLDWDQTSAKGILARCTKAVAPGDIVLFHNDAKHIVEALPQVLAYYQAQGYSIVPISSLLLGGESHVDGKGTQKPGP